MFNGISITRFLTILPSFSVKSWDFKMEENVLSINFNTRCGYHLGITNPISMVSVNTSQKAFHA